MCVFNGRRVTRADFIELMKLRKELKNAMDGKIGYGYDYSQWPIVRPAMDGRDITISMAHWEFVPDFVHNKDGLPDLRSKYMTLNARGETLLQSRMYADAALHRRCLVLSSNFYEYQHVRYQGKADKIPYHIRLRGREYFYMAGIWQQWTDKETGKSGDCFAIVTTAANEMMAEIHNTKKRMPTILPQQQAFDWLFKPLTPAELTALATYQLPSAEMEAWPVGKDFRHSDEPDKLVRYAALDSNASLF